MSAFTPSSRLARRSSKLFAAFGIGIAGLSAACGGDDSGQVRAAFTEDASLIDPPSVAPPPNPPPSPPDAGADGGADADANVDADADATIPDASLGENTTRRVGVDYAEGQFVVFDETHPGKGIFHGHVRTWDELRPEMQNALIRSGYTNRKGRILLGSE
jgi:hypothetical protein